mmetsp:Transcript_54368/g.151447  ORF Transcript_54368/g.151447 Transcript_54368/m.151447 type:complete len:285 (+) Transcript_54368:372-1226(+)
MARRRRSPRNAAPSETVRPGLPTSPGPRRSAKIPCHPLRKQGLASLGSTSCRRLRPTAPALEPAMAGGTTKATVRRSMRSFWNTSVAYPASGRRSTPWKIGRGSARKRPSARASPPQGTRQRTWPNRAALCSIWSSKLSRPRLQKQRRRSHTACGSPAARTTNAQSASWLRCSRCPPWRSPPDIPRCWKEAAPGAAAARLLRMAVAAAVMALAAAPTPPMPGTPGRRRHRYRTNFLGTWGAVAGSKRATARSLWALRPAWGACATSSGIRRLRVTSRWRRPAPR